MCGTNAGSQLKLVNGADLGIKDGGEGNCNLTINGEDSFSYKLKQDGKYQHSAFAIAELIVWPRGLSSEEMYQASDYLMKNVLGRIETKPSADFPFDPSAWYKSGGFNITSLNWPDATGN